MSSSSCHWPKTFWVETETETWATETFAKLSETRPSSVRDETFFRSTLKCSRLDLFPVDPQVFETRPFSGRDYRDTYGLYMHGIWLTDVTLFCLQFQQPSYLASLIPRYVPARALRSSSLSICVPTRKTTMAASKSFSSVASGAWNALPSHLSSVPTLPVFRRALKHHLFLLAYPDSSAKSGLIKPAQCIPLCDTVPTTAIAQPTNTMPPI